MTLPLREPALAYSQAIHPFYEQLKRAFVQVGGFLILRSASVRLRLEMSDEMRDLQQRLESTHAGLTELAPPPGYRYGQACLVSAAEDLRHVLADIMTRRRSHADISATTETRLRHAYHRFKHGSACELGLIAVDMNCACCAPLSTQNP